VRGIAATTVSRFPHALTQSLSVLAQSHAVTAPVYDE